jgi:hypothetical protein
MFPSTSMYTITKIGSRQLTDEKQITGVFAPIAQITLQGLHAQQQIFQMMQRIFVGFIHQPMLLLIITLVLTIHMNRIYLK